MRLPDSPWMAAPGMQAIFAALGVADGETRIVGGAVRDALAGFATADVDLATRLSPDAVMRRLREAGLKGVPTGLAHGTVTAVAPDAVVEVTTLRRDLATDGRRATVAFTDDWREDAARRDFTFNALYADPLTGTITDYFGGVDDLRAGRVRFIGAPLVRIAEDHLRILRFFRFHARFGRGAPDAAGLDAATARANDLMALSRERIRDELIKLLALPNSTPTVATMVERAILTPVLPEITAAGVAALARLDMREAEAGVAPHPLRRLAALLAGGAVGVGDDVGRRLKLSNADRARLAAATGDGGGAPDVLAYRIGAEAAVDRLLLGDGAAALARRLDGWERPRIPVGGGDLIALGVTPGPQVSRLLKAVEAEWIAAGFPADREAVLAMARRRLARSGTG